MFLTSLANILPRRASTTAFLCLVVAHLEWPDIRVFLPLHDQLRGRRTGGGCERPCRPPGGRTWPSTVPAGPRRSYPRRLPHPHGRAPPHRGRRTRPTAPG